MSGTLAIGSYSETYCFIPLSNYLDISKGSYFSVAQRQVSS